MPEADLASILLVDDEPTSLMLLNAMLSDLADVVVQATSGEQAILRTQERDFALIIIDVNMPEMDGFQLAERLRSESLSQHSPVMFLTALPLNRDLQHRGYSTGAVDYLLKPIEPMVLRYKVQVFLDLFRKTAQVKRQARLLRQAQALDHERQLLAAQSKVRAVGVLVAGVAHNFNNLLQIMLGQLAVTMRKLPPDSPFQRSLTAVDGAGRRAESLVRRMMVFGRGPVENPDAIDGNAVACDAAISIRPLLPPNIQLDLQLDPEVGHVHGDHDEVKEVLVALALNARDAMPDGGALTLETHALVRTVVGQTRQTWGPAPYASFVVRDTGHGMDESAREHLFEPFFTTKGPDKGVGLGLCSAFWTAQRFGGRIEVETAPNSGSSFHVYLLRAPPPSGAPVGVVPVAESSVTPGAASPRTAQSKRRESKGKRPHGTDSPRAAAPVLPALHPPGGADARSTLQQQASILLIVSDPGDEDSTREALQHLGSWTLHFAVVRTVDEALMLIHKDSFDLVVADDKPTGVGGKALLAFIKRQRLQLPVVLFGRLDASGMAEAIVGGAADYLPRDEGLGDALRASVSGVLDGIRSGRAMGPMVDRFRDDMMAMVSHDLRGPASNVLCYSEVLLDDPERPLTPKQHSSVERIHKNAEFMIELLQSVMDTAQIESRSLKLILERLDLRQLVRDSVERSAIGAQKKQIELVLKLPPQKLECAVDQAKLQRILGNLISNAIKFSARGTTIEVGLSRSTTRLEGANEVGDYACLWVRDSGQGIPAAEVPNLFKKFSMTTTRPTAGEKGSGLGLYIVKEFVELHRGNVQVETATGQGSTFKVLLPAGGDVPRPLLRDPAGNRQQGTGNR